jgi:hypothetical protein
VIRSLPMMTAGTSRSPVRSRPTRATIQRGGLLPFFQHLAPEGWLRGLQARAGGTADQDDFGLLLHYGADCIGAVGILPLGDEGPVPLTIPTPPRSATAPRKTLSGVQKSCSPITTARASIIRSRTSIPHLHRQVQSGRSASLGAERTSVAHACARSARRR